MEYREKELTRATSVIANFGGKVKLGPTGMDGDMTRALIRTGGAGDSKSGEVLQEILAVEGSRSLQKK